MWWRPDVIVVSGDTPGTTDAANAAMNELNDSGVEGDVLVTLADGIATVTASFDGTSPSLPHAMHIHFDPSADSSCPDLDAVDGDGDGMISTAEGLPAYGPVQIALTTDGDVSPDSGLALDRFAVAAEDGRLTYERVIELPADVVDEIPDGPVAVVLHGLDMDDSGAYDGDARSSLDDDVPLEATLPVACGTMVLR